jgi:DNA-binding FadR family transcriptional regulator
MMSAYGVSRESLREALRILEVQGMLLIRRGPGGGPVVAGVDPAYFARTASLYFHLAGATYDEVFETWEVTEPFLAEKVARTPNRLPVRRALAPFTEHVPGRPEPEAFASASGGFHAVVAELSHNRVLTLVVQAISHIVAAHVEATCPPREEGLLSTSDHGEIARAIVDGRASKARRLMSEHISQVVEHYRALCPQRMYDLVEWR